LYVNTLTVHLLAGQGHLGELQQSRVTCWSTDALLDWGLWNRHAHSIVKIYQQNVPQLHNAQKKTFQHKALFSQYNYAYIQSYGQHARMTDGVQL